MKILYKIRHILLFFGGLLFIIGLFISFYNTFSYISDSDNLDNLINVIFQAGFCLFIFSIILMCNSVKNGDEKTKSDIRYSDGTKVRFHENHYEKNFDEHDEEFKYENTGRKVGSMEFKGFKKFRFKDAYLSAIISIILLIILLFSINDVIMISDNNKIGFIIKLLISASFFIYFFVKLLIKISIIKGKNNIEETITKKDE